jgi:hypothetical protein
MTDPPHDVPDRGPDIVVTAPRQDVLITITHLKLIAEKCAEYARKNTLKVMDEKWHWW